MEYESEIDTDVKTREIILNILHSKDKSLDLSNLGLKTLPPELYEATFVENFYLNDNCLEIIPKEFFMAFPKLKFLDLRFNEIKDIPKDIRHLTNLEILLIDGNEISLLPTELGLLKNLKGLNIGSNPIVSPGPEVICQGYRAVLKELNKSSDCTDGMAQDDLFQNDSSIGEQKRIVDKYYKTKVYHDIHNSYLSKTRSSSLNNKKTMMTQSEKHNDFVTLFPEPISLESIEQKMIEQMRLAKIKEVKQKRDAKLQSVKDKNVVVDWREEARDMQMAKRREQMNKLPLEIKLESDGRILEAPFKVEKESLEMISQEQLHNQKQKTIKKSEKPAPIDRELQLMIEVEKRNRQKTIQNEIRKHSEYLNQKRYNTKPKESAKEELEKAKRDLEIALTLQKELKENM